MKRLQTAKRPFGEQNLEIQSSYHLKIKEGNRKETERKESELKEYSIEVQP